ncbi:SDR family NAD(P)-dependent oxidoreductase [Flammeovirga sp. SJP92]|uniref:SDR family NAD(P)-dependent oxidoreductase n=1 Tax=Flammeovirga sp. SJP92 TaxID=1775430 RepID=UPI0007879264|nr:SDR family oxidoreductase [Flammeovirga sp. SJP92]KXX71453.1 3-oxoacyl-ACP reductase [Flammeovirga sp. SJP92]
MANFFSLEGQVAIVTGGTSGIGLKTAERFIEAGAKVVISGRKDGTEIAEKIGATFVQCDVSSAESVEAMVNKTVEVYGKIDILVNNAGANFGYDTMMETDIENFDKNFAINTKGVVHGIKFGVPQMNDGGRIVNVASAAAVQGVAYLAPYVASKWAVVGITKTAAVELGSRGIRANVIAPTSVNTPMANTPEGQPQLRMEHKAVPLGRIAEPEEVASLIHFLAAKDCDFVNGQVIGVDGGFTAGMSIDAYNTLAAE